MAYYWPLPELTGSGSVDFYQILLRAGQSLDKLMLTYKMGEEAHPLAQDITPGLH